MNRLQQAMLINSTFDHLYATDNAVTTIKQFNVIYNALEEIDELINTAESEQLDEELEYELTPACAAVLADEAVPGNFSADMSDEFSEFSPSVGTFEGTETLADIVGREAYSAKRAPVGERVYVPYKGGVQQTIAEAFTPCGAD